jgi:hypothetical protein
MGGDGGDLGGDDVGFWRAEAQRWRAQAEQSGAEAAQLRDRVVELEGQVGALTEKVAELARLAFGKSSEKLTARQAAEQTLGEGGPDGAERSSSVGRRGVVVVSGRGRGGTAAGTTPICRLRSRSATCRRPSGCVRAVGSATSRSAKSVAS